MTAFRLFLLVASLALGVADHAFVYLGYDHMLDYDRLTGESRAFDFRRGLDKDSQCDVFVFPPLIEKAHFVDVLASTLPSENTVVSYLGKEDFLVNHLESGDFVIRRCSGFMPQQTRLPCEVVTVGKNEQLGGINKYFFAGNHLVLRSVANTKHFDILYYDWDVHGSGNPLHTRLTGELPFTPGNSTSFAYLFVAGNKYMMSLDETTGFFAVRKFDTDRDTKRVFGDVVLEGTVQPGYSVRTLDENNAVVYHPTGGDYEVWRVIETDNKLEIETVKQANITRGHSCVAETRYQCISQPGCGWCGESIRCHPIDHNRKPCDGSLCANIVDAYSPDYKKYQKFEKPNPAFVIEYDDPPTVNPRSPLRDLSKNGANPIIRENDLEAEKIEGVEVNPAEGVVFVPPPNTATTATMDKLQNDASSAAQVEPDVTLQEHTMNNNQGKKLEVVTTSPSGAIQTAPLESDMDNSINETGARNLVVGFVPPTGKGKPDEELRSVPDLGADKRPKDDGFKPSNDGTAREEDLMNGVRSHYSSLIPKGGSLSVARPELNDKPPPPTESADGADKFVPHDTAPQRKKKPAPTSMMPPSTDLLPSTKMEIGVASRNTAETGLGSPVQSSAMSNAQYTSTNIHTPHYQVPEDITREHSNDLTGQQSPAVHVIAPRADEQITEGFHVAEVPLTTETQKWAGVATNDRLVADFPAEATRTDDLRNAKESELEEKKSAVVETAVAKASALEQKVNDEGELKTTDSFEKGATSTEKP